MAVVKTATVISNTPTAIGNPVDFYRQSIGQGTLVDRIRNQFANGVPNFPALQHFLNVEVKVADSISHKEGVPKVSSCCRITLKFSCMRAR